MPHSCKAISLRLLRLSLVAVAMMGAACEPYKVVEPGTQPIGDGMTVSKTKPWVHILQPFAPNGPDQVWTLDGIGLNALLLYGGAKDGDILIKVKGDDKVQPPKFTSTMEGLELQELIGTTVSRALAGGIAVEMLSLAPASFMGAPGFETEFSYPTPNGLKMRGYASGANIGGELYLMIFVAPQMHYYEKDVAEVRAIAASALRG
jgi:hypothetical protein